MFIVVIEYTPQNRITKILDGFGALLEAETAIAELDNELYPDAFACEAPNEGGNRDWLVDPIAKTLSFDVAPSTLLRDWKQQLAPTDKELPRWFEDYIDENEIVLKPGRVKDNYDNKKNIRSQKPV